MKWLSSFLWCGMFLPLLLLGDNFYWKAPVDGLLNDPACWDLNRVPAETDRADISQSGTYRIGIPDGVYTNRSSLRVLLLDSTSLTLDFQNGTFLMPIFSTPTYTSEPFGFYLGSAHFFNIECYGYADAQKTNAIVRMENALVRAARSGSAVTMDVDRGTMNLYDPEPPYCSDQHRFVYGNAGGDRIETRFHKGTRSRFPIVQFRGNARYSAMRFDGGEHEFLSTLGMPTDNFNTSVVATNEFVVEDTAKVNLYGCLNIGGGNSGGNSSRRTFRIGAGNGGTLTMNNTGVSYHSRGGALTLFATNNATIDFTGQQLKLGDGSGVTSHVVIADSVFRYNGNLLLGNGASNAWAELRANRSRLETKGSVNLLQGSIAVADSEWNQTSDLNIGTTAGRTNDFSVSGGTFSNVAKVRMATCSNAYANVVFSNGTHTVSGEMRLSSAPYGVGDLLFTGKDLSMDLSLSAPFSIGWLGTGRWRMAGGDIRISSSLMFGQEATGIGFGNMTGGAVTITGADGLVVGAKGSGEFTISGGTLTTPQVRLAYGGAAHTNTLRMTGGLLSVTQTSNDHGVNVADNKEAPSVSRLVLEGGVLQSHRVRGWFGARAKGGNGLAVLSANGGTIRTHAVSTGFVENFDCAELGPRGLTLHADLPVKVSQDFTNQEGMAGLLRKTGVGTLTLTGTNSLQTQTEVCAGTLLFASNACHRTFLTVTNCATACFEPGNQTVLTGLRVGDDENFGQLCVTLGTPISVAGSASFKSVILHLLGDQTNGVYPIVVCKGEVDETTKTAWSIAHLLQGKKDVFDYTFETEYDADADQTTFSLHVTDSLPFSQTLVWSGPGSAWHSAENWLPKIVPALDVVASFSDAAAPDQIMLSADAEVGCLQFDSPVSFRLSGGTASIQFPKNGSIDVRQGGQTVDAKIALAGQLSVNVEKDARLTLSQSVLSGGVSKKGLGELQFSETEKHLPYGLDIADGRVVLPTGSVEGEIFLRNASLSLLDNPLSSVLPFLSIVADEVTQAVLVRNESDLSIGRLSLSSGALIKHGPGTLELSCDTSSVLAVGNGACRKNSFPETALVDLNSPTPPTAGYAGFTVAEGHVVIHGSSAGNVVSMPYATLIGMNVEETTAQPALTFDGVNAEVGANNWHLMLGMCGSTCSSTNPVLNVLNGSFVRVNTVNAGSGSTRETYPEILVDRSTLSCSWCINLSQAGLTHALYDIRNGSKLFSNTDINWFGDARFILNNSLLAKNESKQPTRLYIQGGARGKIEVLNGGVFCINDFLFKTGYQGVEIAFDDGVWESATSFNFVAMTPEELTVSVRPGGISIPVPEGAVFRVAKAFTGEGGLTKKGGGILLFDTQERMVGTDKTAVEKVTDMPLTLDYAGVTRIEQGAVVVSNDAARANASFILQEGSCLDCANSQMNQSTIGGSGVVTNGSFQSACIAPTGEGLTFTEGTLDAPVLRHTVDAQWNRAGALHFDDCTFSGRVQVDLGRTVEDPVPLPLPASWEVATYTGTAPDVTGWRIGGTGLANTRGIFSAKDGRITVKIDRSAFLLFLR